MGNAGVGKHDQRSLTYEYTYTRMQFLSAVSVSHIDVKKRFYVFYFGHVFLRFLAFFILSTFFIFKNVGKIGV